MDTPFTGSSCNNNIIPNTPVFITHSAYFNFLREYWEVCGENGIEAQELVNEASNAWKALKPEERTLFEEGPYFRARFANTEDSPLAIGMSIDMVPATKISRGTQFQTSDMPAISVLNRRKTEGNLLPKAKAKPRQRRKPLPAKSRVTKKKPHPKLPNLKPSLASKLNNGC